MPELTFIQDTEASTSHQNVYFAQLHPSVPEAKLILVQYLGKYETTNVALIGVRQEDSVGTNILWRQSHPNFESALAEAISIFNLAVEVIEEYGVGTEAGNEFYSDHPEIALEIATAAYLDQHQN
jgi:hypothetical protein